MESPKTIFHVDLDAYYASLAIRNNPDLVDRPIVVGPNPKESNGRGVVLTCSYEARKFGIRSGMPVSKAKWLCPDEIIYVRVDWEDVHKTSKRIHSLLKRFADDDHYQPAGCDEGYLDVTRRVRHYNGPEELAREIQHEMKNQENLSCSVGIGPNKLVGKIASDFNKPLGITRIDPNDVLDFLGPLSVRKIIGVGPKTASRLKHLGIHTIADIRDSQDKIERNLGPHVSNWLVQASFGEGSSQIRSSRVGLLNAFKSISHETTFLEDSDDWSQIEDRVQSLTLDNCRRIHRRGLSFRTITIKLRFANFDTCTKSTTLSQPCTNTKKAIDVSLGLLQSLRSRSKNRRIRLVGSRFSGLQKRMKPLSKWFVQNTGS